MDKSNEYVKMCDCKEVQDYWNPKEGDLYLNVIKGYGDIFIYHKQQNKGEKFWLPRQDQLQELINKNLISPFDAFSEGILESYDENGNITSEGSYFSKFETYEQLWLAFYMANDFNKEWKKDKWRDFGDIEEISFKEASDNDIFSGNSVYVFSSTGDLLKHKIEEVFFDGECEDYNYSTEKGELLYTKDTYIKIEN